jgi:nucleotide-binding universal stress UspA family protein
MMNTSIICGVDGSPDSRAALAVAKEIAQRLEARLVLVNVVEYVAVPYATVGPMGAGVSEPMLSATTAEQHEAGSELLANMADAAGIPDAQQRVVTGFAAERLAELADEEQAEMIVVGSRGRGAFKAAILGSVSTSLIGVARCPVLVVPPGAAQ